MDFDNIPNKTINRILTAAAVLFLMFWAWKWFGPGHAELRGSGEAAVRAAGFGLMDMVWISIAVVCGGYLLWRLLTFLFWHKYFNDEEPPDDPEE
ncbi:MAG: hypothetical protein LLF78_02010 [Synergistaceae bacterium]|nr:hypothetical protein [Synergistaceae bacterium]